jgi:hypothetical protein
LVLGGGRSVRRRGNRCRISPQCEGWNSGPLTSKLVRYEVYDISSSKQRGIMMAQMESTGFSVKKVMALLLLSVATMVGPTRHAVAVGPASAQIDKVLPVVGLVSGQVLRLDFLQTVPGPISGPCQVAVVCNNAATGAVVAGTGATPLMVTAQTASFFDVFFDQVAVPGSTTRAELYCSTTIDPGTCGEIVQSAAVYNQSTGETNYIPLGPSGGTAGPQILLPCGKLSNGMCGGACPKGSSCVTDSTGGTCSCPRLSPPCGATNGVCGGACAGPEKICRAIIEAGVPRCSCVPP